MFALKGESLEDYRDYTHRIFDWPGEAFMNMILDDGGHATLLLHLGMRAESAPRAVTRPTCDEERALFVATRTRLRATRSGTRRAFTTSAANRFSRLLPPVVPRRPRSGS